MHTNTAFNHQERAKGRLRELYSSAPSLCPTADELHMQSRAIRATCAKCPQWVRSFLDGYDRALYEQIDRKLVYFYTMPDGRMFSTHRDRPDYYEKHGLEPREVYSRAIASGHYWIHPSTGEPKPFYVSAYK